MPYLSLILPGAVPFNFVCACVRSPCQFQSPTNTDLVSSPSYTTRYAQWQQKVVHYYPPTPVLGALLGVLNLLNLLYREEDFRLHSEGHRDQPEIPFILHPPHDMLRPKNWDAERWWIYQDTVVDLTDFLPVLDTVLEKAGVQRKQTHR